MEAYSAVYAPQELTEEQVWEEVENWVNSLLEEGYDLSEYTWEEMYESYIEEQGRGGRGASVGSNPNISQNPIARAIRGDGPRRELTPAERNRARMAPGRSSSSRPPMPGLPASARQVTQYPAGVPTGVGGGNAGASRQQPPRQQPPRQQPPRQQSAPVRPAAPAPQRPSGGATTAAPPKATPAAPQTGSTGRPLVGGIERRTPTRAEMDAAKAYRTPAATTGTLGAATAAASKPAAFSPSSSTPTPTPTPTPTSAAPTPTPTPAAPKKTPLQQRLNMSFDPFDVVIGHLLDEGYADTEEAALAIMANMSGEWRQSIIEAGENIGPEPKTVGGKERDPNVKSGSHKGKKYGERQTDMKPGVRES
jgi:hypothetical protein